MFVLKTTFNSYIDNDSTLNFPDYRIGIRRLAYISGTCLTEDRRSIPLIIIV